MTLQSGHCVSSKLWSVFKTIYGCNAIDAVRFLRGLDLVPTPVLELAGPVP